MTAVKEEVVVPMGNRVLKVVDGGRDGGDVVFVKAYVVNSECDPCQEEGVCGHNWWRIFFDK